MGSCFFSAGHSAIDTKPAQQLVYRNAYHLASRSCLRIPPLKANGNARTVVRPSEVVRI